ncbi:MAG: hypothetical protein AAF555_03925 [Verrucomicrobiota bacterium]
MAKFSPLRSLLALFLPWLASCGLSNPLEAIRVQANPSSQGSSWFDLRLPEPEREPLLTRRHRTIPAVEFLPPEEALPSENLAATSAGPGLLLPSLEDLGEKADQGPPTMKRREFQLASEEELQQGVEEERLLRNLQLYPDEAE